MKKLIFSILCIAMLSFTGLAVTGCSDAGEDDNTKELLLIMGANSNNYFMVIPKGVAE